VTLSVRTEAGEHVPEHAKGSVQRLREQLEETRREVWAYQAAYEQQKREGGILRNALWRRIRRLETAFKEANRQRRELRRR
jgi:predicted RNase H-like nuclease (RuvC/YqgF family)